MGVYCSLPNIKARLWRGRILIERSHCLSVSLRVWRSAEFAPEMRQEGKEQQTPTNPVTRSYYLIEVSVRIPSAVMKYPA